MVSILHVLSNLYVNHANSIDYMKCIYLWLINDDVRSSDYMPWSFRVTSKLKDEEKRAESIWTYYLGICLNGLKEKHDMET